SAALIPKASGAPYELDTTAAPSSTAVATAVPRLKIWAFFASTSRIWHSWQTEWIVSTSSATSTDHPLVSAAGRGAAPPNWLTFSKQPFFLVHGGRPYSELNFARSSSMVGASKASTTATVSPVPPAFGS